MSTDATQRRQLIVTPLPGYDSEIGRWMWALEDARQRTRDALASLKPEQVDRRSNTTGHSIGTLLYHIAAIELDWLATDVMEGQWRHDPIWEDFPFDVRDDDGRLTFVSGLSPDNHWQRLDTVRQRLRSAYKPMSLDDFRRIRERPDYDVTPEWVLHHLSQHEASHRDELIALVNL